MNKDLQTALTFAIYLALSAGIVVAFRFQLIDATLETVLLTGTLGHLGISFLPTITSQEEKK